MYNKLKHSPFNDTLRVSYKRYRNFCNNLLKKIKRQYECMELNKARSNPKKLWNTIKEVTHSKKTNRMANSLLTIGKSAQDSVNLVNKFFINIGKELVGKVKQLSLNSNKVDSVVPHSKSLVFLSTDEMEVERLIQSLRSDCAIGIDGISSNILKQFKTILVPPLTYIFNLSISNGIFPELLKRALIIPIFKSGDADCVNNYRPISILSAISKVLEKIMNNRLISYLDTNNILSNRQYGFRRKKSTNDAVLDLTNFVVEALDKGRKSIAIFLDLSKAFDTVSIPHLISKLSTLGIRDKQLGLFSSYLTNRKQCVKIGENVSSALTVEYGVPQGSILGPTLFWFM